MTRTLAPDGTTGLAMPPRPAKPLSSLQLIRVARNSTIAACDEELFDELVVERRFFGHRALVVSDPDGVRRVLLDNQEQYPRIRQMRAGMSRVIGTGLLATEGEVWRRHRRLVAPALDHRAILPDAALMVSLCETLAEHLATLPSGRPVNLADAMTLLLTVTIARQFGDTRLEPLLGRFINDPRGWRIIDFLEVPQWLHALHGRDTLRDSRHAFDPLLLRLIAQRRDPAYRGERDLLWRLANTSDRNGDRLSDDEVGDEAATLALSGVDTTMRGLTWVWYLLAMHPEAEARVHVELDTVLGDRAPTAADVPRLVYSRRVIDESLRLYPPIPAMARRAAADDTLCGRPVRRGSTIVVMPWIIHRHRKLWRDPDVFDPARFEPEETARRSRFAYIPFALGPHICVGASLALMQMQLIIAALARRFRFRLAPGYPVKPIGGFLTLRADRGLWCTIEPRDGRAAA